jgi:5-hydroxyisourate hydrolase-like protein (transthyretin family)
MKYAKSLIVAAVLILAMGFSRPPKIQPIAAGSSGSGTASLYAPNASDNYIVRPGETLSTIASQNGTTASALETANPDLANMNNTVQPGERLNVPNANEGPTAVLVQGSSTGSSSSSGSSGGSQATLVIGGFPANAAVQIGIGMETAPISSVMNATTDANGQLTKQVSMPSGLNSQMSASWVAVAVTTSSSSGSSGSGNSGSGSSGSSSSSSSGSSSSNSSSASASNGQLLVVSNALTSSGPTTQSSSSSSGTPANSSSGSTGSSSSNGSSSSSSSGAPANSSSGSSNGSSSGSSGSTSSTGTSSSSTGSSSSSSSGAPASSSSGSSNGSSSNPGGSSSGSSSSSSSSSSGSATIPATGKASPAVKLTPTQGGPGTRVLVQASGYPANTAVNVELGAQGATMANLATDQTDANGNLTTYVTIPNRAQGSQQASWAVTVATTTGTSVSATSGAFTVPAAQ